MSASMISHKSFIGSYITYVYVIYEYLYFVDDLNINIPMFLKYSLINKSMHITQQMRAGLFFTVYNQDLIKQTLDKTFKFYRV